ncbi:MAG: response regulator transcription factor [Acidobacteriota bacterium]
MRVLIIEDDHDVAANVGEFLEDQGHEVDFAYDGPGGLQRALSAPWDAVVLDLRLPGLDGLEICRQLRQERAWETPVLMLTARDTLPDRLEGFGAGADDYLVKPFALSELAARLEALNHRGLARRPVLRVEDLELDTGTLIVTRQGRRLDLKPASLKLLRRLMEAAPAVLTREDLERVLWTDEPPESAALNTHIYNLRRAIDRPFERPLLHSVSGVGYRLGDDGRDHEHR